MRTPISQQDRLRFQRAYESTPQYRMKKRIETIRKLAEQERQKEIDAFNRWAFAHEFVTLLENLRDANRPRDPDEPWSETFCTVLRMLPEEKDNERELWLEYETMKGSDLADMMFLSETTPWLKSKVDSVIRTGGNDESIIQKLYGITTEQKVQELLGKLHEKEGGD